MNKILNRTFPSLSRLSFLLVTTLWISLLPNWATLSKFLSSVDAPNGVAHVAFVIGGWTAVFAITLLLLTLLSVVFWGRTIKWLCAIALISASILGYFSLFLGTQFERTMFANMLQTHAGETLELIGIRLIVWVLLLGVIPALILAQFRVASTRRWWHSPTQTTIAVAGSFVLCGIFIFSLFQSYASAGRNRSITFHTLAPANIVAAGISHWISTHSATIVRAPRGEDAKVSYKLAKPRLMVFVLGETARAQNNALNGYARETNERMRAENVIYFPDTESCGTATAISLPCIFSGMTREDFSLREGRSRETLIDVVARSGVKVIWRDNDGGCKGVCSRADYKDLTNNTDPKWCTGDDNCFDEILLDGLEADLRTITQDTLLIIHVKGSHGPAYYKRYPPAFERFKPTCKSNELTACDVESLVNAYDNTLVYTDHVLGETVSMLKRLSDQFIPAMLYASDHGESLGEKGLFLHGMPYAIAPKEQTRVPMMMWFSPQYLQAERWTEACVRKQATVQRSHDNVYHTLLGLMEIATKEYNETLDIFAECDKAANATPKP